MIRNFWEGGTLGVRCCRTADRRCRRWILDHGWNRSHRENRGEAESVLRVECRRMIVNVRPDGFDYADRGHRGERRAIAVDLGQQEPTSSFLASVFSRILVADPNTFLNSVPEYWKDCIKAAVSGSGDKRSHCRFGLHFSEMFSASDANMPPGKVVPASPSSQPATQSESAKTELTALRIGKAVSAPKAVYDPEPKYSQPALEAKEQGTCVLTLIVDSLGAVKNIQSPAPLATD